MKEEVLLNRIVVNLAEFRGKPILRGGRIPVEEVLERLATGETTESLLSDFPSLERDDVLACLIYARRVVGNEWLDPDFEDAGEYEEAVHG